MCYVVFSQFSWLTIEDVDEGDGHDQDTNEHVRHS